MPNINSIESVSKKRNDPVLSYRWIMDFEKIPSKKPAKLGSYTDSLSGNLRNLSRRYVRGNLPNALLGFNPQEIYDRADELAERNRNFYNAQELSFSILSFSAPFYNFDTDSTRDQNYTFHYVQTASVPEITFSVYEDGINSALKFGLDWQSNILDSEGFMTESQYYKRDIAVKLLSLENIEIIKIKYIGCILKSLDSYSLDYSTNEILTTNFSISVDDIIIDTNIFQKYRSIKEKLTASAKTIGDSILNIGPNLTEQFTNPQTLTNVRFRR